MSYLLSWPIMTALILIAMIAIIVIPRCQVRKLRQKSPDDLEKAFDHENEARRTILQIFGGAFIVIGLFTTNTTLSDAHEQLELSRRQLKVAQDGQVTDRFIRATAQIGDDKMSVRLGGIYALRRIGEDSREDYWTVINLLAAYVRDHSPWPPPGPVRSHSQPTAVPQDIQEALSAIGQRDPKKDPADYILDLSGVNMRGAYLVEGQFGGVILRGVNLEKSDLREANLGEADLTGADLKNADLSDADLRGADLTNGHLEGTDLTNAHLEGADLASAIGLTLKQVNGAHIDRSSTKLSPALIGSISQKLTNH